MENNPLGNKYLDEVYRLLASGRARSFRDIVEEKKKELGIGSDYELSKMVGVANNTLVRLIDEETQKVDLFAKLHLCRFLGIDRNNMLEHYEASLSPEHIGKLELAAKANFIRRNFHLEALKKMGFIKSTTDFAAIDRRLTSFFDLTSIYQYAADLSPALFSKVKQFTKEEVRKMWVVAAITQFKRFKKPYDYDREGLLALVAKVRFYTLDEEKGLVMVLRALYKVGVTVIIQKYLSNTSVRGASLVVDGKPCVVLTDFRQSYSTLWFSLLHELYHILFDLEGLKAWKQVHLSGEEGYSLTDDLFKEDMADGFARDRLLTKAKLDFIRPMMDSHAMVKQYSDKVKVHESIIYNFHCYNEKYNNGRDVYSHFRQYFGSSEKAVRLVRLMPFDAADGEPLYGNQDAIEKIYNYSSEKP